MTEQSYTLSQDVFLQALKDAFGYGLLYVPGGLNAAGAAEVLLTRHTPTPSLQPAAEAAELLNDYAERGARIDRLTRALLAVEPALSRLRDHGRLANIVRGALDDAGDSSLLLASTMQHPSARPHLLAASAPQAPPYE